MTDPTTNPVLFRKATVILLTVAVSAVFFRMIWGFLMALLMAAICAGLSQPLHRLMLKLCRQRKMLASLATLTLVVLLVVLPLLGLLGIVVAQAFQLKSDVVEFCNTSLEPMLNRIAENPKIVREWVPEWVPIPEEWEIRRGTIAEKLGKLAGAVGQFTVRSLQAATAGTAVFLLQLFVMLYAMFFFLKDGAAIRDKILGFLPLPEETKERLIEKGLSVTRATIKGTLVIGFVQGLLGGLAFAVLGISGSAFWGTAMAVLSVIPGVGAALIWIPAAFYLMLTGHFWSGVLLLAWGGIVISSVDNILRPRLVGGDTKMPDLLILVSTLGGLGMFGAVGLVIGPVIAALFVTMWEVFGVTFKEAITGQEPAQAET
jgi:predicted PurR-regulated permease PerM